MLEIRRQLLQENKNALWRCLFTLFLVINSGIIMIGIYEEADPTQIFRGMLLFYWLLLAVHSVVRSQFAIFNPISLALMSAAFIVGNIWLPYHFLTFVSILVYIFYLEGILRLESGDSFLFSLISALLSYLLVAGAVVALAIVLIRLFGEVSLQTYRP